MMAARAVYMTVLEFFCRGVPNGVYGYIKVKRYAGQRVIAIDCDSVIFDLANGYRDGLAIRTLRIELHVCLNLVFRWKHAAWYFL